MNPELTFNFLKVSERESLDDGLLVVSQELRQTHSQIQNQSSVELIAHLHHLREQEESLSKHHYSITYTSGLLCLSES